MPVELTLRNFYDVSASLAERCEEYSLLRASYFESGEVKNLLGALRMPREKVDRIIGHLNILDEYRFTLPDWNEADTPTMLVYIDHEIFTGLRMWVSSHEVAHLFVAFISWHISVAHGGWYRVKTARVAKLLPECTTKREDLLYSFEDALCIRNALAAYFEQTVTLTRTGHFEFEASSAQVAGMIQRAGAPGGLGCTLGVHGERVREVSTPETVAVEAVAQPSGPNASVSLDLVAKYFGVDDMVPGVNDAVPRHEDMLALANEFDSLLNY